MQNYLQNLTVFEILKNWFLKKDAKFNRLTVRCRILTAFENSKFCCLKMTQNLMKISK
jgi:hypothetical protein